MQKASRYSFSTTLPRALAALFLAVGATSLAGCETYGERRDTMTIGAGDSVRANIAMHTDDFWPRQAFNRDLTFDGERATRNVRAYRERTPGERQAVGTTTAGM